MTISNPSPITSSRSGHAFFNSSYKYAGLILANNPRALRSFNNPASGLRSGATSYHLELPTLPPTAPRSTASEALAIATASSVRGTPHSSIEQPPIKIFV